MMSETKKKKCSRCENSGNFRWLCADCMRAYRRKRYKENTDKMSTNKKKYRDSTKGKATEKEYEMKYKLSGKRQAADDRMMKRLWEDADAYKAQILRRCKFRANRNGVPFDLCLEDIGFPDVCPVLGMQMIRSTGKADFNSPSIDRLVPELGYVKDNVRIISWRANTLKNNATLEEIEALYNWMKKELGKE